MGNCGVGMVMMVVESQNDSSNDFGMLICTTKDLDFCGDVQGFVIIMWYGIKIFIHSIRTLI